MGDLLQGVSSRSPHLVLGSAPLDRRRRGCRRGIAAGPCSSGSPSSPGCVPKPPARPPAPRLSLLPLRAQNIPLFSRLAAGWRIPRYRIGLASSCSSPIGKTTILSGVPLPLKTSTQKYKRTDLYLFCFLLDFRFQRVVVATAAVAVVVSSSRRTEKDHINGKDDEKTKWGEEAMKDVAACRWLVVGGPRKLGARGVGIDGRLGVVVDDAAGGSLEDDEAGDALDAPGIGEALALGSLEGHCGPGHGVPVGAEGGLLVVKGHEEDLKLARRSLLHLVVECSQCWREGSAWRAPVCAKVDAEVFLGLEQRSNIDQVDVFAHHGRAEQ